MNESQVSLVLDVKEIPAPQEQLLSGSNKPISPEQMEFNKLVGIIDQLSSMGQKNETIKEYKEEAKQKEEELRKDNFTNFTDTLVIDGRHRDFGKLKSDLQSEGVIKGMTLSESDAYRQKIRKELLDVLGLDPDLSSQLLGWELRDKQIRLANESEKVYQKSAETKVKLEEIAKVKLIDVLEGDGGNSVIFNLEKGITNAIEASKTHSNYEEVEKAFMDNCLTIFTSNPNNLSLMNETILNNGEKFFLDTVKEHYFKKISSRFPENDHSRVMKTVSDKVDFNYGQHRLQQFISKNPEIGSLIDKAKWLEYYSTSEGRMKQGLERLKLQLSESKINLNSSIEVGKKQVLPHRDNAVFYELTLDEIKNNIYQAEIDIKDSQAQTIALQNELHNIPKEGFFNKEKIKQQKEEINQKMEGLRKNIDDNQKKKMEMASHQHHIFREISEIEECINRVGFNLESGTKMTIEQFVAKIDSFINNPKFSEEEKKMAKKYVEIRMPMDKIANKYFFHEEYSYWSGDKQGENNILGWEHIGK
jgi:hypothetical protein